MVVKGDDMSRSRFDYRDPGTDPAYCDALSPEPDEEQDGIETDLADLVSTIASIREQATTVTSFDDLMALHAALKPIEQDLMDARTFIITRAEHLTPWGV